MDASEAVEKGHARIIGTVDRPGPWLGGVGVARTLVAPACVLAGAGYALHDRLPFRPGLLLASVAGAWLVSIAAHSVTPERRERPTVAAGAIGGAVLLGVVVAWLSGPAAAGWALLGVLAAAAHSVPPLALAQYGPVPAATCAFLVFGPSSVLAGYAAQNGTASFGALVAALPLGLFAATATEVARLPRNHLALGVALSLAALALAVTTGDYPPLAWIVATAAAPLLASALGWELPVSAPVAATAFAALVSLAFALERLWPR